MRSHSFEADAKALNQLVEALPELVLVLDPDGYIVYLNRAEPGYEPADFIGKRADELVPPASHATFQDALERLRATGEPQEYETKVELPDGFEAWYGVRITDFDPGSGGRYYLLVGTNITELKEARSEIEQLHRLLPVCSWCRKIQTEAGEWVTLEAHLSREGGTRVSHGMCPECSRRELGDHGESSESNGNVA